MRSMNLLLVTLVCAAIAAAQGPAELGTKIDRIALQDLTGKPAELKTAGKITAVVFVSAQCPVSNAYNERMNSLYADYSGKGVQFVFVNSNGTEPAAEVAKHASDHGFKFQVYKDDGNAFADRIGGQVTPHVFVFDKEGALRYKGAIDDSQNAANVKKNPTRDALNALLSGQQPPVGEVKAFGCTIKRVKKAS